MAKAWERRRPGNEARLAKQAIKNWRGESSEMEQSQQHMNLVRTTAAERLFPFLFPSPFPVSISFLFPAFPYAFVTKLGNAC